MEIDRLSVKSSRTKSNNALYFWIMGLVAFIIGLLLIIVGDGLQSQLAAHIVRDLGISFLVAAIVGFGVDLYTRIEGEERLRRILAPDGIRTLGIKDIYANRLKLDFLGYIKSAEPGCEIRLLGISMNRLANLEAQAALKEKLQNNCRIKLLLLDASADEELEHRALAERVEDIQYFKQEAVRWNQFHHGFVRNLPPRIRERIEIRYYRTSPDYFIVDNDRTMLLGFYLRSHRGEDVPHIEMEIKRGGAYSPFRDHFETLWAGSAEGEVLTLADRRQQQMPVGADRRRGQRRQKTQPVPRERRQRKSA
ncbi:MAG TPA: hypothetical protein VF756_14430 [Thermoanaerobaculia bacterium]